jgi:phage terminase large subunit GpA-like protein
MLDIHSFEFYPAANVLLDALSAAIKPDERISVSEWADRNRVMTTATSPDVGPYRTSRTPYLKEIMDCLSPHNKTQVITFVKGAQVGATECGLNWIGSVMDKYPAPMMYVVPTLDLARKVSKGRIQPMINACPALNGKVKDQAAREAGNSMEMKEFDGGHLLLSTSNSASALRSHPIRFLFLDEMSAFESDVEDEGDPVELAKARTVNFGRKKKIFQVSTPTIRGFDRIETEFNRSTQEYYHVPCPYCGAKFVITWSLIKWSKDEDGRHQPDTVHLECPACKEHIGEHLKTWMFDPANGAEWVASAEGEPNHRGFHLSSLYSPLGWNSWSDIVKRWLNARERSKIGDQAELKTFMNTQLGESWIELENQVSHTDLWKEREEYPAGVDVPMGGVFLTVGADIQKDRIEASVYAFGEQEECWAVEHNIYWGNPLDRDDVVWKKLDELIYQKKFRHESGKDLSVSVACVDSGAWANEVYQYVIDHKQKGVFAVKGVADEGKPFFKPSKNVTFGRNKLQVRLYLVGTFEAKRWITLRLLADKASRKIHFPVAEDYDEEFFKQLTSERMVTKYVNGYPKRKFIIATGIRNEALDTLVYALTAKKIYDPSISAIRSQLGIVDNMVVEAVETPIEKPSHMEAVQAQRRNKNQIGRPKKSWMTDW